MKFKLKTILPFDSYPLELTIEFLAKALIAYVVIAYINNELVFILQKIWMVLLMYAYALIPIFKMMYYVMSLRREV